jgi:hypothetical protein
VYSAEKYLNREAVRIPGRHDGQLMLFRDPPPWIELEKMTPPEVTRTEGRQRLSELAAVDTTGPKAREAKRLADLVSQKRRKVESTNTRVRDIVLPAPESRNPFRRQSAAAVEGASKKRASSKLPGVAKRPGVGNGVNVLKPISSLKTPSFPKELRAPLVNKKSVAATRETSPAGSRGKPTIRSSEYTPPSSKPDKEILKGCLPSLFKRSAGRPHQQVPIRVSDPPPSSKGCKRKESTGSFDWAGWGAKSKGL